MTDPARSPLIIVGGGDAVVCEGDSCDVPAKRDDGIVAKGPDSTDI